MEYLNDSEFEDLECRTWGSAGRVEVSPQEAWRLIKEVAHLRAQEAMLTDAVVMAAALYFDQLPYRSPAADYASEVLHSTAVELVAKNPRLKGAFKAVE